MIPGEIIPCSGELELNSGRETMTITVSNTGDRPVQVGSHFHFYEVNTALLFERESTIGMRLNIPAGTAVRFVRNPDAVRRRRIRPGRHSRRPEHR